MAIYVTADPEGNFKYIENFCRNFQTTKDDMMIMLGDVGLNYTLGVQDHYLKEKLSKLPLTFLCIHGNHEERPENISSYSCLYNKVVDGNVYVEEEFPNILFACDDSFYNIQDKLFYVLGGAYSVDKYYRLAMGRKWFPSEQNEKLKAELNDILDNDLDSFVPEWYKETPLTILTHTCPKKYQPTEAFLSGIDQSTVDNSMEELLDKLEAAVKYQNWYVGHFHIAKTVDKIHFLYHDIIEI